MSRELVQRIQALERRIRQLESHPRRFTLRGWRDDFLGDSLAAQYSTTSVGGSSVALLTDAHGGWLQFTAAAGGANNYVTLYLGGDISTLDADYGWTQVCHFKLNNTTGIFWGMSATDRAPWDEEYRCSVDTNRGVSNWLIESQTGGAGLDWQDSGVAFDTNWHWHRIDVYPNLPSSNYRIDHFVDGVFINSKTNNMGGVCLEPRMYFGTRDVNAKSAYLDFWAVVPRWLI